MNFKKHLVPFIVLLTFFSCQESELVIPNAEIEDEEVQTIDESFGDTAIHSFIGRVIDENQNPILDATIKIGSETTSTDSKGVFSIKDVQVFKQFAYVKATKAGYVNASRSLVPVDGVNRVTIMMLNLVPVATVTSGVVEVVSLPNGITITLQGNYEDKDGLDYSGTVDVIVHHLDPSNDDVNLKMPGMLIGASLDAEPRILQSYGMLSIELRGSTGEKLQIAKGSFAELILPLDTNLLDLAPETIKLWYFNEDKGYWQEEGMARLIGNMYSGKANHLSFWNFDTDLPATNLCINLKDSDGNPVANQKVRLSFGSNSFTRTGYTNNEGKFRSLIPHNQDIILKAYYSSNCTHSVIFASGIGSFTEVSEITITIPLSEQVISEKVVGVFTNCDADLVTDGYVLLKVENKTFVETLTNGDFYVNFLRCQEQTSFSVEGVDSNSDQTTGEIDYIFTTPLTDIGTISACN